MREPGPRLPFRHPRWLPPSGLALLALVLAGACTLALTAPRAREYAMLAAGFAVVLLTATVGGLTARSPAGAVERSFVVTAAATVVTTLALIAADREQRTGLMLSVLEKPLRGFGLVLLWLVTSAQPGILVAPLVRAAVRARVEPSHDGGDRALTMAALWLAAIVTGVLGWTDAPRHPKLAVAAVVALALLVAFVGAWRRVARLSWVLRVYAGKARGWRVTPRDPDHDPALLVPVVTVPAKVVLDRVLRPAATSDDAHAVAPGVGWLPRDAAVVRRARRRLVVATFLTVAATAAFAVVAGVPAVKQRLHRALAPPRPFPPPAPPRPTRRPLTGVAQLAAANAMTCARMADGTVRCWGAPESADDARNWRMEVDPTDPTAVPGLRDVVELVASIPGHFCARTATREVWCWGTFGVRDRHPNGFATPYHVPDLDGATRITTSFNEACAWHADRSIRCWYGHSWRSSPQEGVRSLAPWPNSVCAVLDGGAVRCWVPGGPDRPEDAAAFRAWSGYRQTEDAAELASTGWTSCIRHRDGAIACSSPGRETTHRWRIDASVLRGLAAEPPWPRDHATMSMSPGYIVPPDAPILCALGAGRTVHCYLLRPDRPAEPTMEAATRALSDVVEVAATSQHACVRLADSTVRCWGANHMGQLGDGTHINSSLPVVVTTASP